MHSGLGINGSQCSFLLPGQPQACKARARQSPATVGIASMPPPLRPMSQCYDSPAEPVLACAADQALLAANDAFLLPDSAEAAKARAAAPATVGLAEFASFMVEWHALAARTGNSTYADVADHVVHMLQQRHPKKVCPCSSL